VKLIKRIVYLCITKPADAGTDPSQIFDDGRVTSLKKILVLFPLAIMITGLALWGSVSLVIDLFTDDPFDSNDDDDWLWVVFIFVGIIVLSFFNNAWGAAAQKTNMDLRADAANRIYIKNNSADSNEEKSKEQRLVELETLFQKGLIDNSEYVSSRLKILGE